MEIRSAALQAFVRDFDLRPSNERICFDAVIYFSTKYKAVQIPSEVVIEPGILPATSRISLLHPDLEKHFVPTIIFEWQLDRYLPGKCLVAKGRLHSFIEYTLSIHPTGTYCSPQTLEEIHRKQFN